MPDPRTATDAEKESVRRYLVLMVEITTRLEIIAAAMDGRLNLTPAYARELCYFQFRRIVEIIALGCLILHGDIPATQSKNVRKEWNADKIMRLLHELHEHFFPQPIVRTQGENSMHVAANVVPGALTRSELQKLYAECGSVLHRGSIISLESEKTLTTSDYSRIGDWLSKIIKLMQEHVVTRALVTGLYMVSLRTTAGGPQCSILSFDPEGRTVAVSTVTVSVTTASDVPRDT